MPPVVGYGYFLESPNVSPPLACFEMKLTFHDVMKLKNVIKVKKYFDQHCCVACLKHLFLSRYKRPPPPPLLFVSPPKIPYKGCRSPGLIIGSLVRIHFLWLKDAPRNDQYLHFFVLWVRRYPNHSDNAVVVFFLSH